MSAVALARTGVASPVTHTVLDDIPLHHGLGVPGLALDGFTSTAQQPRPPSASGKWRRAPNRGGSAASDGYFEVLRQLTTHLDPAVQAARSLPHIVPRPDFAFREFVRLCGEGLYDAVANHPIILELVNRGRLNNGAIERAYNNELDFIRTMITGVIAFARRSKNGSSVVPPLSLFCKTIRHGQRNEFTRVTPKLYMDVDDTMVSCRYLRPSLTILFDFLLHILGEQTLPVGIISNRSEGYLAYGTSRPDTPVSLFDLRAYVAVEDMHSYSEKNTSRQDLAYMLACIQKSDKHDVLYDLKDLLQWSRAEVIDFWKDTKSPNTRKPTHKDIVSALEAHEAIQILHDDAVRSLSEAEIATYDMLCDEMKLDSPDEWTPINQGMKAEFWDHPIVKKVMNACKNADKATLRRIRARASHAVKASNVAEDIMRTHDSYLSIITSTLVKNCVIETNHNNPILRLLYANSDIGKIHAQAIELAQKINNAIFEMNTRVFESAQQIQTELAGLHYVRENGDKVNLSKISLEVLGRYLFALYANLSNLSIVVDNFDGRINEALRHIFVVGDIRNDAGDIVDIEEIMGLHASNRGRSILIGVSNYRM